MKVASTMLLLCVLLEACTVLPTVEYRAIAEPRDAAGLTDTFYRNESTVEVAVAAGKSDVAAVTITSRPGDYKAQKLGIRALTDWRSATVVNINKVANTDRISSVGVEVTDTTVKRITDIGAIAGKFIALMGMVNPDASPPCIAAGKTVALPVGSQIAPVQQYKGTSGEPCIQVSLQPLPPDALKAEDWELNKPTHNFYYSACRDATIDVTQGPNHRVSKTVRVADPRYLQFVQFPPKGSIALHSECGVSVQTDKAAPDSGAAIVEALETQAKAIKDALDARK